MIIIGILFLFTGLFILKFKDHILVNKNFWFLFPKDEQENKMIEKIMIIKIYIGGWGLISLGLFLILFSIIKTI
jgi:hypothetical protein